MTFYPMNEALDRLMDAINQPGPVHDDERDWEAAWEARHDPEGDLDRMEDQYEKEIDR